MCDHHHQPQVSLSYTLPLPRLPSFPTRPGSPILTDSRSDGSPTEEDYSNLLKGEELTNRRQLISIDMLPDDVLLSIFDFHAYQGQKESIEVWQSLVHVCRRWRSVVFGSPGHLNLRLVCTTRTRAKDTLGVWPALPLIITCEGNYPIGSVENIVAVLERSDRVCQIDLKHVQSSDLESFLAAMQQPFPELTKLTFGSHDEIVRVAPDSFLGGSAPRLQRFHLDGIPFPGLPKLLMSATHLVIAYLENIPHSGYLSPDAMVTALSTLTSLEELLLDFKSPRSCPGWASRHPPPPSRSVLPVLTSFWFKGVSEYFDDLVACIDAPQLNNLSIAFFNDIEFDTPQSIQFISRAPAFNALKKAHISFVRDSGAVHFLPPSSSYATLDVEILCTGSDWQLSSLEQVCTMCLPFLFTLEDLYIYGMTSEPNQQDRIENTQWLELLQPFMAVKNLYLSEKIASLITPALRELVGGRTTEVLPTLQNIFLERLESLGPVQEEIGQFVAARRIASHPIAISRWTH